MAVIATKDCGNIYRLTDMYIPGSKAVYKKYQKYMSKYIDKMKYLRKRYHYDS